MNRRLAGKIALAALSPVVFLAICELGLRIAGVEKPRYAGLPAGVTRYWLPCEIEGKPPGFKRAFARPYRTRAEPLPNFVRDKPANGLRIFVLGESSVAGLPYELGSFSEWLQLRLSAMLPDRAVEVVNGGNPGWFAAEIRTLLDECLEHRADAIVWMVGHNEMVPLNVLRLRAETEHPALARAKSFLLGLRTAVFLGRFVPSLSNSREIFFDRKVADENPCFGAELPLLKTRYREALEGAAADAKAAGVPMILCTMPRNARECPPSGSYFSDAVRADPVRLAAWKEAYKSGTEALDRRQLAVARAKLSEARAIDETPASLHFALGRLSEMEGKPAEARTAFLRAVELDSCPMRAAPWVERDIREVAARESLPLADLERIFDAQSAMQLAGYELIADNVHPNLRGHERIAEEILRIFESELGWPVDRTKDIDREEGRRRLGLDEYDRELSEKAECTMNLGLCVKSGKIDELWKRTRAQCDSVLARDPEAWIVYGGRGLLDAIAGRYDQAREAILLAMEKDAYVCVSYLYFFHEEPPYRRLFDLAKVDMPGVESKLTPGLAMQLSNRRARKR